MNETQIQKPGSGEYNSYYHTYISYVTANDLIEALRIGQEHTLRFYRSIPESKLDYRYETDKWTIKEILEHHLDVERIFSYRALRFSRNDHTPLAGFDENEYAPQSNATERMMESLLDEYKALRESTIAFFKNISADMSLRTGIANGKEISVRALGFIIPGHEIHHMNVIRERYLLSFLMDVKNT